METMFTYENGVLVSREVWDTTTLTLFDGAGTQISQRALTLAEQASVAARAVVRAAETNRDSLRDKARQALITNAAYLAIPAPTAAEVRTQTELLTREVNGLIRLLLGQLDDISDT